MVARTLPRMAGLVFRENRVPYYQRLFQKNDGKPTWMKTPSSPYMVYGFYTSLIFSTGASLYAIGRVVMGHRSWFGKE